MDRSFIAQLNNYRLTTAEILYWMPDHRHVLQSFVWQNLDLAPKFPALSKFLDFWEHNLDGKVHRVAGPPDVLPAFGVRPVALRRIDVLGDIDRAAHRQIVGVEAGSGDRRPQ